MTDEMKDKKSMVVDNGNYVTVTVRPDAVPESLKGKLSDDDIANSMAMVNEVMAVPMLCNSLSCQCGNISGCSEKCKSLFRSIPNGNHKADIMLLNKIPTEYETHMMFSHCDTQSVFLSLILSKINMTRHDVYCTDMVKCCANLDERSFRACIDNYLIKEVQAVKPKIIICNGLAVLKSWGKLGYIEGLPSDVSYGNIYDVVIGNVSLKITCIFDLERVLQKTGNDYVTCKGNLWIQILNAFNAIQGGQ